MYILFALSLSWPFEFLHVAANQKYFLLFLGYTCTMSAAGAAMIVIRLYSCLTTPSVSLVSGGTAYDGGGRCDGVSGSGDMVMVVIALVLACLFALFTGAMLADQLTSVLTNMTQVCELTWGGLICRPLHSRVLCALHKWKPLPL